MPAVLRWLRDRSLTLVMLALFVLFLAGQLMSGWREYNDELSQKGHAVLTFGAYLLTGHPWEALFENWESEFLQMTAFVTFTTVLYQIGSPESRRPGAIGAVDADPRAFQDLPGVPWPVRRGGWVLAIYEHSLGLALGLLFLFSFIGHVAGGWAVYRVEQVDQGHASPGMMDYLQSHRFWFESFQNWQSEFLSVAVMVWLAVYLRQRWSPESKPVHASHDETGR